MRVPRVLKQRLRSLFRRNEMDAELARELEFHLAALEREHVEAGLTPQEARLAARRQLGNAGLLAEQCRDQRRTNWIADMGRDLRYGWRLLRQSPGFTAVAVLSLALGVGANTAIFSLMNALMLRLLPVERPEELVALRQVGGWGRGFVSYPYYAEMRGRTDLFDGLLARSGAFSVRFWDGGAPGVEFAQRESVSGNYFSVLGVGAARGRLLTPADDVTPGAHPVAVVSYAFWQRRFGGDPGAIGRTVYIEEEPYTVIGVAAPGFHGVELEVHSEVWTPLMMGNPNALRHGGTTWLWLLGRKRVPERQLEAAANVVLARQLHSVFGHSRGRFREKALGQRIRVEAGGVGISLLRERFGKPVLVLMAAVLLVLLIVCVNLANLLLARGAARQREIAMRAALGASRGRLIRQWLAECILLAAAGTAAGLVLAVASGRALVAFLPESLMRVPLDVMPDRTVLVFTLAAAAVAVLLFGLLPALRVTRPDWLKRGHRMPLRRTLVVAQVALSMALLVVASMFVRTLSNLRHVDAGFEPRRLLTFWIYAPRSYNDAKVRALRERYLERVRALPGVKAVALAFPGPYQMGSWNESIALPSKTERVYMGLHAVSAGYLPALGAQVVRGRHFEEADRDALIVSQTAALQLFGSGDPIGRQIFRESNRPATVIGVVRDVRHAGLREPVQPLIYVPLRDWTGDSPAVVVKASTAVGEALRRELAAVDGGLALSPLVAVDARVDESILPERMLATLSGVFGALVLLLAAIGVYGVLAHAVAQRTAEIGIRMALGAARESVVWLVLRQGLALVALGIVLGIPAALAGARAGRGFLFGLTPGDAATWAAAILAMLLGGLAAALIPARRAASIDPVEALRRE